MLSSKRSYFLYAWYEWMRDNHLTAYVIVNAEYPHVNVPVDYIENGRITLNIAPQAVRGFNPGPRDNIWAFEADFDPPVGLAVLRFPTQAVIAIYAQENKEGAFFQEEQSSFENSEIASQSSKDALPKFTVVKETEPEETD